MFLLPKISIFDENFDFYQNLDFGTKFGLLPKLQFLTKI